MRARRGDIRGTSGDWLSGFRLAGSTAALALLVGLCACQSGDPTRGEELFRERGCDHCHEAKTVHYRGPVPNPSRGPSLAGVRRRYRRETLEQWLNDPEQVYRELGRRPLNPGSPPMPQVTLKKREIDDLLAFLGGQ